MKKTTRERILEIIKENGNLNHLGTICYHMGYKPSMSTVEKHLQKMQREGLIEIMTREGYTEISAV
jgi:Mn-dependent DtxR family transcriptional regulator